MKKRVLASYPRFAGLALWLACCCLVAHAGMASAAGNSDAGISHFMEEIDAFQPNTQNPEPAFDEGTDFSGMEISPELIVNTLKSLWDVVQQNKPVANVSNDYAQALPKGIASPAELEGFSDVKTHTYRLYGKNMLGMNVYDIVVTLIHQYGGSYQGKGHYLATVSVVPSKVDVMLGYKVDLKVTQVSVVNVGTALDPIASLTMEIALTVNSPIKQSVSKSITQFRGDTDAVHVILGTGASVAH